MLRHAPKSKAAPLVLNVAAPHQSHLGDDESAEARLASLREEVASKLEVASNLGPHKPNKQENGLY